MFYLFPYFPVFVFPDVAGERKSATHLSRLMVKVISELDLAEAQIELEGHRVVEMLVEVERVHDP